MLAMAHPDAGHQLAILAISQMEFRAAVRRRAAQGDIAADAANSVVAQLNEHLQNLFLIQPVNDAVLDQSVRLVDRYTLRAYDSIQLAGCLVLRSLSNDEVWFLTSDRDLIAPAQDQGCHVVDPTT